jgi:hypothetical protein
MIVAFGNHSFTGLLLYEESNRQQDNFYAQRELSLAVDQLFSGSSQNQIGSSNSGDIYNYVNKSIIGRINYNYKSKYLAEFSFRNDGSSRFSPTKTMGFLPCRVFRLEDISGKLLEKLIGTIIY